MEELFYTYILTNKNHTVLYIGVTSDLKRRLKQHKQKSNKGFTGKYNVEKLLYFESSPYVENAIKREKQLKKWNRA
ncbi:GIY-YIG nuclease family protein [Leeuwenhoekiella sp. ZYFB001]|uniref:GIY-YIG nuclease family protein n=1 Tax=Leeuwenhoekiella sp. ZYFB001 TaxID=2719912 RepID=UPI00293BA037|nr:GIY-YIG nuclease family protein [Leeuwenhoekiella sp. ZYFB001]